MKLKKLEIIGFKSFYDKAAIEFPPGISAVVGPNGCGKSNIIDALRWVMGEQSVKQLRGKSMEDIIFSGANARAPLNMAEVSLLVTNDNGDAPEELKDFSEIMLTRRLYRSGESAYFLNKQPCRLKDIHNVFLGSGLGSRSYAVIQQGNIGAITEASPEERRFFIEEAAGVTRYKSRKNETLRKIKITNQNLLRVSDILSEIKRQMGSLKRQARKAEIYNNYQKRIQILDICLGLHYYDDYKEKIDNTDLLIDEIKDVEVGQASRLKKLDAAVESIKLKRHQKTEEISARKAKKFETQRNADRIENDLSHLRREIERLTREADELKAARQNLEQKNEEMISEIAQVEKDNIRITTEIDQVREDLEEKRSAAQHVSDQLAELNRELESQKSRLMDLVAQEAQYKNIYLNASNNKENLQRRLKRAAEEETLAQKQIADIQRKESEAKSELSTIKSEIADLEERISAVREELVEKSAALGNQVKAVQSLELERTTAQSKLTTLQKMADNFEWYKDGVRNIMRAKTAKLKASSSNDTSAGEDLPDISRELSENILGLMADIIETEPSFETAVEAALGESLQYIIVKDQLTGSQAIDYLKSQQAGRSGFIPIASIKRLEDNQTQPSHAAKLLLDQITVKPGFENIAQALLGHVAITDNLSEAIELFNRNGSLQTIVTRNGDLISPQGIMLGGSKDKLDGILSKKQEMKALKRQCRDLDQKLEKAKDNQAKLDDDVRDLENRLQQFIEHKHEATQNEIEAEKQVYKFSEELKNARRQYEIISLEQEQLLGETSDIDAEMTKTNSLLEKLAADTQLVQRTVKDLTEKSVAITAEMEDHNQRMVDLKLKSTALNARLENSNNSLRRLKDFFEDGRKRLEELSREIRLKQEKGKSSREQIIGYEQGLSDMYQQIENLDQTLELNEADYQAIDNELKDSDNLISDIQIKREKTLEKFRLLELELSQLQIKRDNVVNRLEERYQSSFSAIRTEFEENIRDEEISPDATIEAMEDELTQCREKIAKIIDVNLGAIREFEQLKDRYDFLEEQRNDLVQAIKNMENIKAIAESAFSPPESKLSRVSFLPLR